MPNAPPKKRACSDLLKEAERSFSTALTIDVLVEIFALTIGSLKGAAGMIMYCWVHFSGLDTRLTRQAPVTYGFCAWFILLTLLKAIGKLNARIVNGDPWRLDFNTEIVITGGSHGLGLALCALFSANGFKTHCVDIAKPEFSVARTEFHRLDVGDLEQVKSLTKNSLVGRKIVLIHCAGTVNNTLGTFSDTEMASVSKVMQTNAVGLMLLTHAALNDCDVQMVVGVSSSTALANPAHAAAYAASKSAVRTFCECLRHEISAKVLCVVPGQLDTEMFKQVQTPSQFFAPVLRATDLAQRVYSGVLAGEQGEIRTPTYTQMLPLTMALPQGFVDIVRRLLGVDVAAKI